MHQQDGVNYTLKNALNKILTLPGIKPAGKNKWVCKCPAHDDKDPSLSVRALNDGTVLLYCFSGCSIVDITAAIGIDMTDLFPDDPEPRGKTYWDPRQVLQSLNNEALIVVLAAGTLQAGDKLSKADLDRLVTAKGRIREAIRLAGIPE